MAEECIWKQKSRILWLREREGNTSYFHKMASKRRRKNLITPEMVGLGENTSLENLQGKVSESFESRFKSAKRLYVESWEAHFARLDMGEAESLEVPFDEGEIHRELMI